MTGTKPSQRIVGADFRTKLVSALGISPEGSLTRLITMGGDDIWLRALAACQPFSPISHSLN